MDMTNEKQPASVDLAKGGKQLSTLSASSRSVSPKAIVTALEQLCAIFGRPPEWRIAAPLYLAALADLTPAELERAIARLVREQKPSSTGYVRLPLPAEIRAAAMAVVDPYSRPDLGTAYRPFAREEPIPEPTEEEKARASEMVRQITARIDATAATLCLVAEDMPELDQDERAARQRQREALAALKRPREHSVAERAQLDEWRRELGVRE